MKSVTRTFQFVSILSLVIALVAVSAPLTAMADSSNILGASGQLKGVATVKSPYSNNQLLVTVNDMDVALNISDETLVIDNDTGLPASLESLKINDEIFAHYSAAMTKSLPPQSHAIAIVTQLEKGKTHGELFTVKEILPGKEDEIRALNKEGDLIVTFLKDKPLTPFKTKQIVAIDDIKVGSQLFVWYDIVALSYPGQTTATKAVFVGPEEGLGVRAVYTPMTGAESGTITIQDIPINLDDKKPVDHNGILMIPLRSVAEGLDFDVIWNGDEQSVLLDDGTIKTTIYIGNDSYYKASSQAIGLTQNFTLGAAPVLIHGSTYVPASLFNLLYSDNDAVKIEMK